MFVMISKDNVNLLISIQVTLTQMGECCLQFVLTWRILSAKEQFICRQWAAGNRELLGKVRAAIMPTSGLDDEDNVIARLSWSEQMELEDEAEYHDGHTTGGNKVHLTQVQKPTEEFLCKAFSSVSNAEQRQQLIVLDTPFTTAQRLDKVMAEECSKSVKSSDHSLSRIQALFPDAVGPLSGLLDSVDKGTEVSIDDMEGAVKVALTFLGNASSQCTLLCRTRILEEYNKDPVSFGQESDDLFASAMSTLFGPSFPEKASEHLKQFHTLRQAQGTSSKSYQVFSKASCTLYSGGRGASPTICRDTGEAILT